MAYTFAKQVDILLTVATTEVISEIFCQDFRALALLLELETLQCNAKVNKASLKMYSVVLKSTSWVSSC